MVALAARYSYLAARFSALTLQLLAAAVPALGAISPTGNVLPAYPGAHPDPWNVGTELVVGDSATGTLAVSSGSDVVSIGGTAGFDPGVIGSITVSGAGSSWTNSQNLLIGVFGIGKLDVLQGARVDNQDASIGNLSGVGLVTVSGAGSIWTNAADLVVGEGGVGSLTIENQGRVRSADATIGLLNSSSGAVTIDGQQSTWEVTNTLSVGDAVNGGTAGLSLIGAGSRLYVGAAAVTHGGTLPLGQTAIIVSKSGSATQLAIYEGNSVHNAGTAYIGYGTGESGLVEVNGESSILANQGGMQVGVNGSGTLKLVASSAASARSSERCRTRASCNQGMRLAH
jgi:fibronectin-binding autotransporter adhesin